MKHRLLHGYWGALAALTLTFALAVRGEEAPAPAASETKASPPAAVEPAKAPAAPAAPAPAPAQVSTEAPAAPGEPPAPSAETAKPAGEAETAPAAATELRRLDTETPPAVGTAAEPVEKEAQGAGRSAARLHRASRHSGNERVVFLQNTHVAKDETVDQAVSIFGSTTIDGEVADQAVSVVGDTTVNGSVGDQAVSVMGSTTVNGSVGDQVVAVGGSVVVNGRVGGQIVAVGGDVKLGPDAVVNGEIVVVGGGLTKAPTAVVHGSVQQVRLPAVSWALAWAKSALFKGRLLSFAGGASWAWLVALAFLGFYVFLALVFRRGIEKCAETLEQRPGQTILAALLTMLAMPLVFLLLAITGIGVIVVPILGAGLMVGRLFGRAAMLAWFGRRFTGTRATGVWSHPAVAVIIGGLVVAIIYLVPLLALVVHMLIGVLGLGMVIYALILSMRRNGVKAAPAVAAGTTGAAAGAPAAAVAGTVPPAVAATAETGLPPVVSPAYPAAGTPGVQPAVPAASLPRAGFGIRLAASFLDAVLIGLAAAMMHAPGGFLLLFVAYCVVLWALKGTTVGGVICGLKIVRLDDRPVDWSVAVVRALAAFLSLAIVGLGFLWVAFDDARQSWHDKIAGTTIVKVPKGVSLI